jgi:hypothetical protein
LATNPNVEFLTYLESKGWGQLGPDSLARKLKVDASVVKAALNGKPIQRRSSHKLWLATEKSCSCFEVERTPLEEWMWENNHTPKTLSELIERMVGRKISINTLESISQTSNVPTVENASALFQVTGLALYAPEEDAKEATRRIMDEEANNPSSLPAFRGGQFAPNNVELDGQLANLRGEVANLHQRTEIIGRILNITWDEQLSHIEQVASAFDFLVAGLLYFKTCAPAERKKLVERIGADYLSHWVGMLSALTDEKQFAFWQQMTKEPRRK